MTAAQWAEQKRFLSELSAIPGRYSLKVTPWWREPLDAVSDPAVDEIITQKSAQIGYTEGMACNVLGWTMDVDPAPTMVLFPRDKAGKDFNAEKFEPMIDATPSLRDKVTLKSRDKDNRQDFKRFPGGFVKFVGSNSPGNVKSTAARRIIVEEPDDASADVKGQGDAIALIRERSKTFHGLKILIGGTPTIKGLSTVEAEILRTDQRRWFVPCHHCGEAHPLTWDQVTWSRDESKQHPVYGDALPETARYVCPACGAEWTDDERRINARRGAWRATATGASRVRGYLINELVSGFPQSTLAKLAEKYLSAQHKAQNGDPGDLIAFWNQTLGEAWEYRTATPAEDVLEQRAEDYLELSVPAGGLLLTAGVDVQHDRLAVVIMAWGRGEECWVVYWGELHGNPVDKSDPVWSALDALTVDRVFAHATGAAMRLTALSIDSGDGNTADAVYHYARRHRRRVVMATKGSSVEAAEIFRKPRESIDVTSSHKAAKYGLQPYIVGVSRAKDLILGGEGGGRLQLTGSGPGRMHWYRGIRADYFRQLTAEVKAPKRGAPRGKKVWQLKAGARNEALDCTILALHAARSQRADVKGEAQWFALERALIQADLLSPETAPIDMVKPLPPKGRERRVRY